MQASPKLVTISLGILFLYSSCSRGIFQKKDHVYQPPKLGAEYRFDEGLRREKHPQQLFSKKERRDMEKMGTLSKQERRPAPATRISPASADSLLTGKTDSTHTPQTDSAGTMPADTTLSQPTDSARAHMLRQPAD